jgi:OOP family OmpA-OmpF porin
MKNLLLSALLLGSATFASDTFYKNEISALAGYNMAEGNVGLKDDGYVVGGLELQFNKPDSKISPEISVLYMSGVDYDKNTAPGADTSITRVLLNGVYSFDAVDAQLPIVPFVKAGAGYEFVGNEIENYNEDGFVVDAGAGLKFKITDRWAAKAEAIYLAKIDNIHNTPADNNLIGLVGITYSFGEVAPEPAPAPKEEIVEEVVVAAVVVEKDTDGDGVVDSMDKCPETPAGTLVNATGCPVVLDDDKDGVENAKDLCPNTPMGEKVDSNGCPLVINLHINFANDSAEIPASANDLLDKYADFLKRNTNYSAKIVGYTDSVGSASYNQKLSERRAKAVMNALIERGVDPKQLSAIGMGELNPVASNDTPEGRAQNRRIEAEMTLN